MFNLIPGVVSQIAREIVYEIDLSPAIEAFLPETGLEVNTALYTLEIIEKFNSVKEIKSIFKCKELVRIEAGKKIYKLNYGIEILELEAITTERAKITKASSIIVNLESVKEAQKIERAYGNFSELISSEFLPGSPGYVSGSIGKAIELLRIEIGRLPEPLPTGFLGEAISLSRIESPLVETSQIISAIEQEILEIQAVREVVRTQRAVEIVVLENARKVNTVFGCQEISIKEIGDIRPLARISKASELVTVEAVGVGLKNTSVAIAIMKLEKSDREIYRNLA